MYKSSKYQSNSPKNSNVYKLFLIWTYVTICRPQDIFPFLNPLRPSLLTAILLCLSMLFNNPFARKCPSYKEPVVRMYIGLFILMVCSIIFSYYRSLSFSLVVLSYSQTVLYFLLFIILIDDKIKYEKILIICCCGIGLYSIFYLKYGEVTDNRVSFGDNFDPNDMAYVVISFIMFNMYFLEKGRSKLLRLFLILSVIIGFLLIVLSGSRGGFIALLVSSTMFLFSSKNYIPRRYKVLAIISMIAFLGYHSNQMSRFKTIFDLESDYNVTGDEGRLQIWKTGLSVMLKRPFTGVGVGCFPEAIGRERKDRGGETLKWQTAHNSLVLIGTETGVLGFMLYIFISLSTFKSFYKIKKRSKDKHLAKLGDLASIGFTGHMIAAMFISQAYSAIWVFYIALSVVLSNIMKMENLKVNSITE